MKKLTSTQQDILGASVIFLIILSFMTWHVSRQSKFEAHYETEYKTHDDYLKSNLPIGYE